MSMNCSGCGSRLAKDAAQCDLCGTPVLSGQDEIRDVDQASDDEVVVHHVESGERGASTVFCNQCGWENPAGSKFCSKCGEGLQSGSIRSDGKLPPILDSDPIEHIQNNDAAAVGGVEPGAGKRMGMLIGLAVLVIFTVYMMITLGGDKGVVSSIIPSDAPAEPSLLAEYADQETQLLTDLQGLSGALRLDKQRELLTLYFTARRFDLAGAQAEQIGIATNEEAAWIDAGNFFYDWMETSDPVNKAYYSQKSTSSYQRALEINPDNLDVRTDMAVAYLYDPANSMLAIQETMKVLEADSNHVQANFNRGIMLWQINRLDEAKSQFERVLTLVEDPEDPVAIRASDALSALRTESDTPDS